MPCHGLGMGNPDRYSGPVVVGFGMIVVAILAFNPPERWTAPYPMMELGDHVLAYPGAAADTILAPDLDPEAHSLDLARSYALAACGAECRVLAERRPRHALKTPAEGTLILRPEMAQRVGLRGPFMNGGNTLAIGSAGAWGTSYGWETLDEARQNAADWCAHYSRRSSGAYHVRRARIEMPPCPIVAERGP